MADKCNDRVIADTIADTGESKALIEHVLAFQIAFIRARIEEGGYEGVRIAGFGTFRAKPRSVQWRDYMRSLPDSYRKIIRGQ